MLNCGTGEQSPWKSYDDLEENGWERARVRHPVYIYDTSALKRVMRFLKVSSDPEDQWVVSSKHLKKTTKDGRVYYPTGAKYENKYNMELITAESNFGPQNEGPKQKEPPVTGDPNPFPPLKQQSDVIYLEFTRLMKLNKKPVDKLKGFFRPYIVNSETRSIVAKTLRIPLDQFSMIPEWPGRDFEPGSDEFAALLASPNGRGVAWFLATHKDLGHKTISSIRVFKDFGLCILFVFEDVKGGLGQSRPSSSDSSDLMRRHPSFELKRRALSDSQRKKFVTKGRDLLAALKSESHCFPEATFTNYQDLDDWGWTVFTERKGLGAIKESATQVYDLLGASMEPAENIIVTDDHDEAREKGSTTYHPTGALYLNLYNPNLITAISNDGPASAGRRKDPPITGSPTMPFPILSHSSDVMFLEFQRIMAEMNQPMTKLKGIWRNNVINEETEELAISISSSTDDIFGIPRWPGVDIAANSDELAALVAAPNGLAVAYLLLQHRRQLGWKTVTSAKIWYENYKFHVLYLIGDVSNTPDESLEAGSEQAGRQDHGSASSTRRVGGHFRPIKRARLHSDYDDYAVKGKALLLALESRTECAAQSEWIKEEALSTWGWRSIRNAKVGPASSDMAMKQVFEYVGASVEDGTNHQAYTSHLDAEVIDGTTYRRTDAEFNNRYNPAMIIAETIYGVEYQGQTQKPPVTGKPDPFPKLRFWSDVTFLEYQNFMKSSSQSLESLKAVWHSAVINEETQDLAASFFGVEEWTDISGWPGKDFTSGSKELDALVGSANGKSVAFLLLEHRKQLGNKVINKARVWKNETLHVLYTIEDAHTCVDDDSNNSTAHDQRLIRRVGETGATSVAKAKNAGLFFVSAQDSPTDILESCLRIRQSNFVRIEQLRDSGWTQVGSDRQEAVEEEKDRATFDSWLDLNLDLRAGRNHRISYQHLRKTTSSDGKAYHPSGAYYNNLFTEGGIVALDNASPWATGRNMNPQVDGNRNPFPPLKQWSDEAFLVYQDICRGDAKAMKSLRGVLRHTVTNTPTRAALQEYLGKRGELEADIPKPWPGTLYKLKDEGFAIALGTPSGKGVAYLLATHRESLGWKEIYQIRIFSADLSSPYNILYYIRDHRTSPARLRSRALLASGGSGSSASQSCDTHQLVRRNVSATSHSLAKDSHSPGTSNDAEYNRALSRGARLLCELYASPNQVVQSSWTDLSSLAAHGWVETTKSATDTNSQPFSAIGAALKDLKISTAPEDNILHAFVHAKESTHAGHTYPPTNASYSNVFNAKAGAIIADSNTPPRNPTVDNPSPLSQYSDVVFLAWLAAAGPSAKNLRYIFRGPVADPSTLAIAQSALANRGKDLVAWPGERLSMAEADTQAILGSPNGLGVGYLLAQHKDVLGVKVVESVTVFGAEGAVGLCFWIGDVAEGAEGGLLPTGLIEELAAAAEEQHDTVRVKRAEVGVGGDSTGSMVPEIYSTWTAVLRGRFSKAAGRAWSAFRL